jgi:hypothetical protein
MKYICDIHKIEVVLILFNENTTVVQCISCLNFNKRNNRKTK